MSNFTVILVPAFLNALQYSPKYDPQTRTKIEASLIDWLYQEQLQYQIFTIITKPHIPLVNSFGPSNRSQNIAVPFITSNVVLMKSFVVRQRAIGRFSEFPLSHRVNIFEDRNKVRELIELGIFEGGSSFHLLLFLVIPNLKG